MTAQSHPLTSTQSTTHNNAEHLQASPDPGYNGFGLLIPFVQSLGFKLDYYEDGASQILFAPRAEHLNSFEVAHGGALMTLLDVSMATAARSVDKSLGIVTIEMKSSFMRPATGTLKAKGELLHRTRTTAFVQSKVYNAQGELCAHATGTFRYVARKPVAEQGEGRSQRVATD